MSKEKLLTLLVIVLVILNAGVLIFLFTQRQGLPPHPREVFQKINESLQLDEAQRRQFDELRHDHREGMNELDRSFGRDLEAYLELLRDDQLSIAVRDSLENKMSAIEKDKARKTLEHFQKLKNILRPDQKEKFYELLPELPRVMARQGNPPPPRRE